MAYARVESTRIPFFTLAILAIVLLQGVFHVDGGFAAMSKHAKSGRFSNGKALHHVYMGIPIIDDLLALSVSFWDPVCHQMLSVRLLSITLSATLQSLGVFATIESMRKGDKHIMLRWAPVNIFCWQYIGAAIFVPIYFFVELDRHFNSRKSSDPGVPYLKAKSLLPAAIIAILHLYRMVYFPPSGTTTSQHQAWLAVWQLAPFFCYCLVAAFSSYLSPSPKDRSPQATNADAPWIKACYAIFGLFSAIVHLSIIWQLIVSRDPSVSPYTILVPQFGKLWQSSAAASVYIEESLYFLQWDYIIIVIASSLYATTIMEGMYCSREDGFTVLTKSTLMMAFGFACILFSPGLVYSGVLYLREDFLRRDYVKGHVKKSM